MQHMIRPNLGLVVKRQARDGDYNWFFASNGLIVDGLFSIDNKGREQIFPLYLYEAGLLEERRPNISNEFASSLAERLGVKLNDGLPDGVTPEDIFHFVYAIVHSAEYRERYSSPLHSDFPRIPLPGGAEVFRSLSCLGERLIAFHLMQSADLDEVSATYVGPEDPMVRRVAWMGDSIWLDAAPSRAGTMGFPKVPEAVWNFEIGGHQVCEKWLKDRGGRQLSHDDLRHYEKILSVVQETIRLMAEIGKVIEVHGGWPGAFEPVSEFASS